MLVKELANALKSVNPDFPVRVVFDGKIDYNPSWHKCGVDFYLEGVSNGDMKESYAVVFRQIKYGDEETFILKGAKNLPNIVDAREIMKKDFDMMCGVYGRDPFTIKKKKVADDEIWMDISFYNANEDTEDQVRCHWKIMKI